MLKVVIFVLWVILIIFDPISAIVSITSELIDKFEKGKRRMEERPMKKKNGRNLGDKFLKRNGHLKRI